MPLPSPASKRPIPTYVFSSNNEKTAWTVHAITPDGSSELIGNYATPSQAWRIIRILRQSAEMTVAERDALGAGDTPQN